MYILDTVGWLHIENSKLLLVASRKKHAYYLPGGKKEGIETHIEALTREIYEELSVSLIPNSIQLFSKFTADAYGEGDGVKVHITCYFSRFLGTIFPTNEIRDATYFSYEEYQMEKEKAPVMVPIFTTLRHNLLL